MTSPIPVDPDPTPPPDGRAPASPWLPHVVVAVAGIASAVALTTHAEGPAGLRRVTAPEVVLGAFDTVVAILLARPGRRDAAETLLLLLIALPFHVAAGSAVGAGPGHLAASGLALAAWGSAGLLAARHAPRAAAVLAVSAVFALPLAAYGLADFGRLPVRAVFLASPLTGPAILARAGPEAEAADAVPALLAAGAVLALTWSLRDRSATREAAP